MSTLEFDLTCCLSVCVQQCPDYYQQQLRHVEEVRDCLFSDTSDVTSTQLYMTLMDELHMQSLTAEQLMLLYYDDVTREQKNVSDVRRAVRLSCVRGDCD